MKKIIALFIAVVMVLAMVPAMFVATSAATEGDWVPVWPEGTDPDDTPAPLCGYHYTADGFVTDPADLTNYGCGQAVATKTKYDLKTNNDTKGGHVISLDFVVNNYPYGGESGSEDHWISFTVSDNQGPSQGDPSHGQGYHNLMRGTGNGSSISQNCLAIGSTWNVWSQTAISPELDGEGREHYSMVIDYAEGSWTIYICGVDVSTGLCNNDGDGVDEIFETLGTAYIGIKFHSTSPNDKSASMTITNFNGEVPYGDDSQAPGDNEKVFAELADSSTVEAGKPCMIWDSTFTNVKKFNGSSFEFSTNEDGTVKVTPGSNNPWITWGIPSKFSYEAKDFPVLAVLTKDTTAESANIYYAAGEVLGSIDDCRDNFELFEVEYADGWALGFIDLTDYYAWEGRINDMRVGFNNTDVYGGEAEDGSFTVAYMAMFRTEDDAKAYATAYLTEKGVISGDETTAEEATTVAEATTTVAAGEATTTVAAGEAATTVAAGEAATTAAAGEGTKAEASTKAEEKKSGCGSVVGGFAILGIVALAGVSFKKKH